jgi:hypothetical protein
MGRVRRYGYIVVWWIGDHEPRHVHIYDSDDELLGRIAIDTLEPLDDWQPSRKVVLMVQELITEGRL